MLSVPGYQAAAKTGTSNKCLERNAQGACTKRRPDNLWTMGYTPNLVTGVWFGNADASPLADKAESLTIAAPVWKDFMTRAHRHLKATKTTFSLPSGVVQVLVSTLSGQLPAECTPIDRRKTDVFLAERAPTASDPACASVDIDKVTNLLASDNCPDEAKEQRSFYVPYSIEQEAHAQWHQSVVAWAHRVGSGATVGSGSALPLPLIPTEQCDITKTPGRLIKPTLSITSPRISATYPSFMPDFAATGSPAREVLYEIDGKVVERVTGAPFSVPLRVPRSIEKSGEHTLTVTLTDEYFNVPLRGRHRRPCNPPARAGRRLHGEARQRAHDPRGSG